jgi:hypothetical protein
MVLDIIEYEWNRIEKNRQKRIRTYPLDYRL